MDWVPIVSLEAVLVTGLVASILVLVSAVLIGIGWFNHRRAQAALAWPMAPGQVLASGIGQQSGENGMTYYPQVNYAYNVNGQTYQNQRIVFGGGQTGNRGPAEKTVARYPPGSSVSVYFNPANAQDAVLERRSGSTGLLVGMGAAMLIGGCGLFACMAAAFVARLAG
jgi:hypothetical protein